MSSPTKTRSLPAWAGALIPMHVQPTGIGIKTSKDTPQQQKVDNCQQQFEDVTGMISSPQVAELVLKASSREFTPPFQEFSKLMEGVIFTISGLVNPERTELRKMALDMGAKYRRTWTDDSTLLVCPFTNTPSFIQVQAIGGTIVHKDWIAKCYNQKELVAIDSYLLHVGKPWRSGSNFTDFGVAAANDFPVPENSNLDRPELAVKNHNPEPQNIKKFPVKTHGNPGGAGMVMGGEYSQQNQTVGVLMNLPSPVDVQQWVLEDLAATLTWLEQQSDKPEEYELETVAAQGLLVCLDDAVRSLQNNKGLSMVMDNWAFIPRAVKELAVYEKGGQCVKDQLVVEGERYKVIYESQLKKLGFGVPASHDGGPGAAKKCKDKNCAITENLQPDLGEEIEKDFDDDATEIISDTDSRDPADFDSDSTEELDEHEIADCKGKILQSFGLD